MTGRCLGWILLETKSDSVGEHRGASRLPSPLHVCRNGPGLLPHGAHLQTRRALRAPGFLNADLQK